jgi:hypothetical protein
MPEPTRLRLVPRSLAGAAVIGLLAACDFPTDLPRVQSRWVVPAEETRFGVAELLPGDVSVSADSSTFIVTFDPVGFSQTLAELCGVACVAADGLTVPKPPFTGNVASQVDFPPEVFAITVVDGTVVLEVTNGLGFDPIRPAAGVFGSVTMRVTDDADGDVLSELVVSGTTTSFASGTTLSRSLVLAPTDVNGSLVASVVLDSPLGDPVTVDASAEVAVVATPGTIRVSAVAVDVSSESVALDPVDLDVGDIDADVEGRVVEGAFLLDVTNPFGVGADFDLTISWPSGGPILRSASITPAASSQVRIAFTGDEIRSFLGEDSVVLTGDAVVDAAAGTVTVTPGQELVLKASMDLTLEIGGTN